MKEHDGEYLRPNGTAMAMAAQAIVSFSSSAENSLTQNKLWIKFERLIGVLISFCDVYNYRQRRRVFIEGDVNTAHLIVRPRNS